jgi:hypothetical protein
MTSRKLSLDVPVAALLLTASCFACKDDGLPENPSRSATPDATTDASTRACDSPASVNCWAELEPPGRAVFPDEWQDGEWPQALIPVVAWRGEIWMTNESHAWSSADGLVYARHDKTPWPGRLSPAYAFFKNQIWLVGGMELSPNGYPEGTFTSVVWSTPDGITWVSHGPRAFPPRKSTSLAVFQDRLWLFGGATSIMNDGANDTVLNDVWSSDDGVAWTLVTANAPWAPRADAGVEVFDDVLYVVGGAGHNDVWRSRDGVAWSELTNEAEWNVRYDQGVAVFDRQLWVFGGYVGDHRNAQNDVWFSSTGTHWTRQSQNAPWSPRSGFHNAVFKDKLWIFSGKHTGSQPAWQGDIWAMSSPAP